MINKILYLVLFTCIANALWANNEFVIKDFNQEAFYFNTRENTERVFFRELSINTTSVFFKVPIEQIIGSEFKFYLTANTGALISEKLIFHSEKDTTVYFKADSLLQVCRLENVKNIDVVLYNQEGISDFDFKSIIHIRGSVMREVDEWKIGNRAKIVGQDLLLIILLFILGLLSFVKIKLKRTFEAFFDARDLFGSRVFSEELEKSSPFSKNTVPIISLLVLCMSFLLLNYRFSGLINHTNSSGNLVVWMIYLVNIGAFYFTKLIVIFILNVLFDKKNFTNRYFFDYLKLEIWFVFLAVFICTIYQLGYNYMIVDFLNILSIAFAGYYGIRILLLFVKMRLYHNFNIIHLISYLCIAEVLPFVIGLKFFLNK